MLPGEIHGCRWAWCREFFPSSAALAGHVISVHLCAVQPVRRNDLPMLRRVEEGYSQSFDLLSRAHFEAVKSSPPHNEQLPSSLPSPPPSTPTSLPSASLPSPPQPPRIPPVVNYSPILQGLHAAEPLPHTPEKNQEPTFASLSSPADSNLFSPCIPESPSLSRMISDAVGSGKRLDDSPSKSSSSSRASVEEQLTQSLGNDPGTPTSAKQHTVTIADPRKPPLPFNNGPRQQAWYQTRPKTKKRSRMVSVLVSPENTHPPSIASSSKATTGADRSLEPGSTPEWSQPSQKRGPVESQFPYQTQASYDSQL